MDYLQNHLPKGEKILARTKKSAFIFMREVLIAVVLTGIILGLQLGAKIEQKYMYFAYAAAGVILLLFLCSSLVKYASTILVVTTHKFMVKEDIITIKVFDTQLSNIDGIEVEYRTPLRRALSVGNIKINTRNTVHEYTNVSHPDRFTAVLNKQCSEVADSRLRKVRITFGIGAQTQPQYEAEGEKVEVKAKA